MSVQMLDINGVNNNFYHDFHRNCEGADNNSQWPLTCEKGPRIYMSNAWQEGPVELAILGFTQNH